MENCKRCGKPTKCFVCGLIADMNAFSREEQEDLRVVFVDQAACEGIAYQRSRQSFGLCDVHREAVRELVEELNREADADAAGVILLDDSRRPPRKSRGGRR